MSKERLHPIISVLGLVVLVSELITLQVFEQLDLLFGVSISVMIVLVFWNIKRTLHMTLAFASAVAWMAIATSVFPQPSGVNRIWEFEDFLPTLVCIVNFALGAWIYVYNRARW